MDKFLLVGGHCHGDVGAVGNGYQEWDIARQYNKLLAKHLKNLGANVTLYNDGGNLNNSKDMYQETAKGQGMYKINSNVGQIIERHLNSFSDKNDNGTELWIATGLSADKYDKAINNVFGKHFKQRGIKKHSELLNMNVAKQRGIPYRLVEMCFISNKNDINKLVKEMDTIAKEEAEALVGKTTKPKDNSIGHGEFMGRSGVKVYVSLFEWDTIVDHTNDLDYFNYGVQINTKTTRNIYSCESGDVVGTFKPNSTIRYMNIASGTLSKMQRK